MAIAATQEVSAGRALAGDPVGSKSESQNYRLYRSTSQPRTYLVVSTFFDKGREGEHPEAGFERTSAKALGAEIWEARNKLPESDAWETSCVDVTLRAHGFNTRFGDFLNQVVDEADPDPETTFRPKNRFYIGYRWPSSGLTTSRSLSDSLKALWFTVSISVFLILIPALALLWLVHLKAAKPVLGPYAYPVVSAIVLGFGLALLALRGSTYLSDRYRAMHYGVPDLAEFVRDLDDQINPMRIRADIDLVGHSMGCLLLVNAIRVMTDFFHYPGQETDNLSRAATIRLRSLILCAADIPMALAVPGRNNYFLSSLRRFAEIHVFSSDHDIILKWASNMGNWASEPRFDMSSRRLGNAFLIDHGAFPKEVRKMPRLGKYLPVTRPGPRYIPGADAAWSLDPKVKAAVLQFHDCSRCWSVGGNLRWAFGAGALAVLAGLGLWLIPYGTLGKWFAVLIWALISLGAISRWLQVRFMDHWFLGPVLGALADWPSTTAFWSRQRNPHGGYFVRGDGPRRFLARLLATSNSRAPGLVEAPSPIRSSALVIPV